VVFGLFNGLLVKNALATNNYFDNVSFYKDNNGYYRLGIHITTTLSGTMYQCNFPDPHCCLYSDFEILPSYYPPTKTEGHFAVPYQTDCSGTYTLSAGNSYQLFLALNPAYYPNINGANYIDYITFWNDWPNFTDTQNYYFIEYPSITITYPSNNAEIANIFNITGSFTQPSGNTSHFLQADIMPTGTEISSFQKFWTVIGDNTSGNFSITIGNVPAGYYDFRIYFISGAFDHYQGALISNIHIVNDLPPFIPPWEEQPPTTAPIVYQPLEPIDYYTTQQSTYATPTPLYITLTGTFSPVLLSITGNLQEFASNFTLTNASSTGNQIGQSVLLVRSYLSNFNSFFGNFPVSQFLLLYLIALVVVVVLRLIKGLINLFKL
jgi:hypothetical protein